MCGLAAIFVYRNNDRQVSQTELLKMRDAMFPRGPDGCGLWLSKNNDIGLAHRRLAILDLSERAAQPMSTPDGKLRIVFNGEIYNFRELRAQLQMQGHVFHTNSDTEVLLYAYREYGRAMVDRLRGMFAFAIWDEEKRGVFLARDHFGIKPLYFHDDGSTLRVASQVKAILAGGGIDTRPEPAGHVGFFLWGCVPEPYTLYRNLVALPAGHTLWADQCGPRAPHKYFDIAEELEKAAATKIQHTAAEVLKDALSDSVKHHLVADVPVGVFLSSGLDSATLAALAAEQLSAFDRGKTKNFLALQAITLGFAEYENTRNDEVPLARKIATQYGYTHHVRNISRRDFKDDLSNILNAMDQPSIDGINTWFVAREAKSIGLNVALSGVGGDELLGGYPSFSQIPKLVRCIRPFSMIPSLGKMLRIISAPTLQGNISPKFASLFEFGGTYGGAYFLRRGLYMPWELPNFMDGNVVREGWATLQPILRLDEWTARVKSSHTKVLSMEMAFYMRNMLLRDSDWAGMAHSLEIRTPFVDVTLFRALAPYLVSSTPPTKSDLIVASKYTLPDELINRKKTGFAIPVTEWARDQSQSNNPSGLREWSKFVRVQKIVKQAVNGGKRIYAILPDGYGGRGGIAKFNRDLIWSICADSEVGQVIALPRNMPDMPEEGLPIKLHWITSGLGGKCRYLFAACQTILNNARTDLILCGHINLLPIAWIVARVKKAPLWCVIHGIDAWQPHKNTLINRLVRHVDGFISVSNLTRKRFTAWSGVPEENIHLLPNCYDPKLFYPAPKNEMLADRYGLAGKIVLLTVGRLDSNERYKGIDEVIEILPELSIEYPNIAYLIVGDGNDRARLEAKVQALDVANRVVFTGYVGGAEKTDYYRLADVYIMPSMGEGFGIVFLEAMACGLPVIGSKLDGSREPLANGNLGLLVDPRNSIEILDAVRTVLKTNRKNPPEKLTDFSLQRFKERVGKLLDKMTKE
jgi:asparagine synthase (glutamine-hydrolysing)